MNAAYAQLAAAMALVGINVGVGKLLADAMPVATVLALRCALASLVLLPLALWREPAGGIGTGALWQALLVGGFVAPVGTWAVIEAGRKLPGSVVSIGFLLAPAVGVLLSALWLGEVMGWDMMAGGVLIVTSVWLATRS